MPPRPPRAGHAGERRFHVLPEAVEGSPPDRFRLEETDAEHARVVLRLAEGDRCRGLDGAGHEWPLCIVQVGRHGIVAEATGAARTEPAPGEPGAALPFLEVAVAMPRGGHADEMVDALAQLGVARITPLRTARANPQALADAEGRRARWDRIAREACKQCGRLWNVQIVPAVELDTLGARGPATWVRGAVAGPGADLGPVWAAGFDAAQPLILAIGPEGGFTDEEEAWLDARGALALRVGPHTLRSETAAVAALAVLVAGFARQGGGRPA